MKNALILIAATLLLLAGPGVAEPVFAAQPGDSAPAWSRLDSDGNLIEYPQVSVGKPSILFFWAGWCPYCRSLMPLLARIETDYKSAGVKVYAIHIFDDKDPVAQLAGRGFDFRIIPAGDDIAAAYAVPGTPGLFLVDARGEIAWRRRKTDSRPGTAASEWNEELRQAIDQLLSSSG